MQNKEVLSLKDPRVELMIVLGIVAVVCLIIMFVKYPG
jgi:hypothetical protein